MFTINIWSYHLAIPVPMCSFMILAMGKTPFPMNAVRISSDPTLRYTVHPGIGHQSADTTSCRKRILISCLCRKSHSIYDIKGGYIVTSINGHAVLIASHVSPANFYFYFFVVAELPPLSFFLSSCLWAL
jgi:hypothetical protein